MSETAACQWSSGSSGSLGSSLLVAAGVVITVASRTVPAKSVLTVEQRQTAGDTLVILPTVQRIVERPALQVEGTRD